MHKRVINIALAILIIVVAFMGVYTFSQSTGSSNSDDLSIIGELAGQLQTPNNTPDHSPAPDATPEPGSSEPTTTPGINGDGQSPAPQSPAPTAQVIDENEVIGKVSLGDKAQATLLAGRLSATDIATLRGYLKDGVTPEEKKKAMALLYSKFSAKEIEYLKAMYYKYMK